MKQKLFFLGLFLLSISLNAQISNGIRISFLTDAYTTPAQEAFVNSHYDYVMTPVLSQEMRAKYDSTILLLYRSIRGVWEDTVPETAQFDWYFINSHENMFCHYDSIDQSPNTRIKTIYDSYVMDGSDIVSASDSDAINHWINYYAVTASNQVDSCNYDGLFMDSAGHKLNKDELADSTQMPWDYSDTAWRDARYVALSFAKSYLPDKIVVFNGLHSDNGADSSLHLTDGGMWEDFAYNCNTGNYKGIGTWWQAITCMQNNRDVAKLILTVKKPGLNHDDTARIFSVASYLLIENQNTVLTLSAYDSANYIQYYPEFDINLGDATDDFYYTSDSLFVREFENGLVLVNPFETGSKTYTLNHTYFKVIPNNGGVIYEDGVYDGYLSYDSISGTVTIPPVSALILKDSITSDIRSVQAGKTKINVFPNPATDDLYIKTNLDESFVLELIDVNGKKIETYKISDNNELIKISLSNITDGVYFIKIKTGKEVITKKIIKK